VAIHVIPDRIYDMVSYLNKHVLALKAVDSFKVSVRPASVAARLDNIDIYFHDTVAPAEDNAAIIAHVLEGAGQFIAPEHPAMMTELGPGIGTADDPGGGKSFSGLRSEIISRAVIDHVTNVRRCRDFGEFCWQVANRFRFAGINPNDPSRSLPPS
jgi:hypothetical protein